MTESVSTTVYIVDGWPPNVYRHEVLLVGDTGHVLVEIPGLNRERWVHPANVFETRAGAQAEARRRRR